jgi:hypothetical protein
VQDTVQQLSANHVEIAELMMPRTECTLKCSALLQATEKIDEDIEVVAFLDADVVPHATWLRELVHPLSDARVGAAMGNRWYVPDRQHVGSLLRYTWNIAAVVNMFYWKVPWGGTLAVRADLVRSSNLRDLWAKAGCDDVPLQAVLSAERLRLVFVPNLLLANETDCDIGQYLRFTARQLLWVRLYHPVCWWVCAFFQVVAVAAQVSGVLATVVALFTARWTAAIWLGSIVAIHIAITLLLLAGLHGYAAGVLRRRDVSTSMNWTKVISIIPLSEALGFVGLWHAIFQRVVSWRGVDYRVDGPWRIRMIEYRPLDSAAGSAGAPSDQAPNGVG